MKKIISLALASCMLVGALSQKAMATEVSASGYFMITGNLFNNEALADSDTSTTFKVYERVELALDAKVAENVSGQFKVRVPKKDQWDGTLTPDTTVRSAYIDFDLAMVDVRAGYQGYTLPYYLGNDESNPVFDANYPGIVIKADLDMFAPEIAWFVNEYSSDESTKEYTYALSVPMYINEMMTLTPWAAMLDRKGSPSDTFIGAVFDADLGNIFAGGGVLYGMQDSDDSISSLLLEAHASIDLDMCKPGIAIWYGIKGSDGGLEYTGSWGNFNSSADGMFDNANGLENVNLSDYTPYDSFGIVANVADVVLSDFATLEAHIMYVMDSNDEDKDPNLELGASLYTSIASNLNFIVDAYYFMPMTDNKGNGTSIAGTLYMTF